MFDCRYIWKGLYIGNAGDISTCCHTDRIADGTEYEYSADIINSSKLTNMREQAASGKIPQECKSCIESENNSTNNRREAAGTIFGISEVSHTNSIVAYEDIEFIDLRIGNICNLMCTMCSPSNSHLIAREQNSKKHKHTTWSDDFEENIIQLLQNAKNLNTVVIAGGEPFYNKNRMMKIINVLLKSNSNVRLKIITNGTIYDSDMLDVISQFKDIHIAVSLDAVDKSNDTQRWNANRDVIVNNISKYKKHAPHAIIGVVPVISNITLLGLPELIRYVESTDDVTYCRLNMVKGMPHYAVNTMKKSVIQYVAEQLESISSPKTKNLKGIVNHLKSIRTDSTYYDKIISEIRTLHALRGTEFEPAFVSNLHK